MLDPDDGGDGVNGGLESAFGIRPQSRRVLWNGPVRCMLLIYDLD